MKIKNMLLLLICGFITVILLLQFVYFFISYQSRLENSRQQFERTTNEMNVNINAYIGQIQKDIRSSLVMHDLSLFLQLQTPQKQIDELDVLLVSLRTLVESGDSVVGALLTGQDGMRIFETKNENDIRIFYEINKEYDLFSSDASAFEITKNYYDSRTGSTYFAYLLPVYNSTVDEEPTREIGKLALLCNTQEIQKRIQWSIGSEKSQTYVLDQNQIIASDTSNGGNVIRYDLLQQFIENPPQNEYVRLNKQRYFANVSKIDNFDWHIVNLISESDLTGNIADFFMMTLLVTFFILVFIIIAARKIMRNIMTPVDHIISELSVVGKSNVHYRLEASYDNEVGIIIRAINQMLDQREQIDRQIFTTQQKLYETELYQNQTELMYLQSQINPHFLYNTLECVRSIAQQQGIQPIESIVSGMANIFRYAADSQNFVTLAAEVRCVNDYMCVLSTRYGERYECSIYLPQELSDCRMIKMVLQPLVENSINHGLRGFRENGRIILSITAQKDTILLKLTDNGRGIPTQPLAALNAQLSGFLESDGAYNAASYPSQAELHGNIGLQNIRRRLALSYHENCSMLIKSVPGRYTQILITFPRQSDKEQENYSSFT